MRGLERDTKEGQEWQQEGGKQYEYFIVVGTRWILFSLPSATHYSKKKVIVKKAMMTQN